MTIGDLVLRSGVPASTIRYWERVAVLPTPARLNGQRRYAQDAIHRLAVLRLAQACGFHLDEMRNLMHGFQPGTPAFRRWKVLARDKQDELDRQIAKLQAMRRAVNRVFNCKCTELSECGRMAASIMKVAAQ